MAIVLGRCQVTLYLTGYAAAVIAAQSATYHVRITSSQYAAQSPIGPS